MRKIAVFTGNRAEYGMQKPIIEAIQQDKRLDLKIIAAGAHLEEKFGYTVNEIKADGFEVSHQVSCEVDSDSLLGTTQSIGQVILGMSHTLEQLKPDILFVYADRFEGFAAVVAGSNMGIPVAHGEGGDVTSGGALDDYVRHAMTKLSHLHFTTNDEAYERVKRLGEEPWRIHNVGFPLIDYIKQKNFATIAEVQEKIPLDTKKPLIVFTQHSISSEQELAAEQVIPSLKAMEYFANNGCEVILTYPNNDAGGRQNINHHQSL